MVLAPQCLESSILGKASCHITETFQTAWGEGHPGGREAGCQPPVPTCLPGESSVEQPAPVKLAGDFSTLASGLPAEAPDTAEQSQVNPIVPRAPSPQSHETVNESCHFKTLSFEVICSAAKITDTMGTDVHSALRVHRE